MCAPVRIAAGGAGTPVRSVPIWHGRRTPARGADSGRRCAGLRPPGGTWGFGMSGHVQAPSSAAGGGGTPDPQHTVSSLDGTLKLDKDILEHDWKPQVELWLLMLRDVLEEQGYSEAEIASRKSPRPPRPRRRRMKAGLVPRAKGIIFVCLSSYYSILYCLLFFCCSFSHCIMLLRPNICQILF